MFANLFWKTKIPDKLPQGMMRAVNKLKKIKDKKKCLKAAYEIVTRKAHGVHVWNNSWFLFVSDLGRLWGEKRLHCTNLNFLLRTLLVKSRRFEEKDIKHRIRFRLWKPFIHQYLKVKVANKKYIKVDPWAQEYNVPFGKFADENDYDEIISRG